MSNPRFRPRELSTDPKRFGKAQDIQWHPVAVTVLSDGSAMNSSPADVTLASVRLGAARLQHLYAFRIRLRLTQKNWSLTRFATESGVSYDRMAKMLRGQAVMRLEDIAAADHLLGLVGELARSEEFARQAKQNADEEAEKALDAAERQYLREHMQRDLGKPQNQPSNAPMY